MHLSELIRHHKGDRSYDELAKASDGALTSQRLQQMATTQPSEFPKVAGIRGLAKALGTTETAVVLAAAESLGLEVRRDYPEFYDLIPAGIADLPEKQLQLVTTILTGFLDPAVRREVRALPTLAESREKRRQAQVDRAQPAGSAAYDGDATEESPK